VISKTISHYNIIRELGAGGMGEVYLAEDTRLGRQVAIKFLPASYQYDPERRTKFLAEARATSALRSPHIAAIYDIGEHEGAMYIVMEYVEGELLSDKLKRGALGVREAIDMARSNCRRVVRSTFNGNCSLRCEVCEPDNQRARSS
jgi:serine/threonine protein kinase